MRFRLPRPRPPRRGVTLIEMLVTVTLLVLMMTALAQIFGAATGAMTSSRTLQELDGSLRQLDSTIRTDLQGATARFTPPLRPSDNLGYFEYGENVWADLQGEDTDDYVRFTTKAPEGQFFTGRFVVPNFSQPITITSQFAEVIYFLRNGNLYRRVFLIVPERQRQIVVPTGGRYTSTPFGASVVTSWIGLNDVSARPGLGMTGAPILNTLGDLTNRERRAFYPRFANDYTTPSTMPPPAKTPDGIPDENDGDGVPDWYPTLYPKIFSTTLLNPKAYSTTRTPDPTSFTDTLSFPYIFPGAYSANGSDPSASTIGQLHFLGSHTTTPQTAVTSTLSPYGFFHPPNTIRGSLQLNPNISATVGVDRPNHAPLELGDSSNLVAPVSQTWWGFPTWKETMSPFYNDPIYTINLTSTYVQANGLSYSSSSLLPPMTGITNSLGYQPYNDGAGLTETTAGNIMTASSTSFMTSPAIFEDDLLMTGVRSFDIKAYDDTVQSYVDLGYSAFTAGATGTFTSPLTNSSVAIGMLQGFGHEGRMPPLPADFRFDPQSGQPIGDSSTGVVRLRRVYDTWSTDYTEAPATGIDITTGQQIGGTFNPSQLPLYPSYPPPYPAPLSGIQIQIRVVDPRSEHIKVLTLRQDFADKL